MFAIIWTGQARALSEQLQSQPPVDLVHSLINLRKQIPCSSKAVRSEHSIARQGGFGERPCEGNRSNLVGNTERSRIHLLYCHQCNTRGHGVLSSLRAAKPPQQMRLRPRMSQIKAQEADAPTTSDQPISVACVTGLLRCHLPVQQRLQSAASSSPSTLYPHQAQQDSRAPIYQHCQFAS